MNPTRLGLPLLTAVALISSPVPRLEYHAHAAQQELPEVSWICPMPGDEDVNEGRPGRCPKCGMDLVAARLDRAWTCPVHQQQQISATPGKCRLDGRELVPVTVGLYWTCEDQAGQRLTDPGNCANGRPRNLVRELRAHGDHNPRHGGLFFMASDQWHHVEGTYPQNGLFRVYLYDNFTQPMPVKGVTGRVVLREENNRELESAPLAPSRDGQTLEAKIPNPALPLQLVLKIKLNGNTPEQRFDFPFTELSKEPAVTTTAATTRPAPAPARRTPQPSPAPAAAPASAAAPPPAPAPTPSLSPGPAATSAAPAGVPASTSPAPAAATTPSGMPATGGTATEMPPSHPMTAADITACPTTVSRTDVAQLSETLQQSGSSVPVLLNLLNLCDTEVRSLIQQSQFGFVYQPTMFSKDVALALETKVQEIPEARRIPATSAIRRLVLAAWLLDAYGDMGNREKLTDAYDQFAAAIADIKAAYDSK
jgi:hypothetical protein